MKEKITNKKVLVAIFLVVLFGVIGGTIAYYQSSDTFTNEFDAGKYVIKTEETFESPTNWLPGDTTPKELTVTNQGNVDAAVKVCLNPKWEDENGNTLPLFDNNYEFGAIIDLNPDYDLYWQNDCENNFEDKYCFYYYKKLEPGETTKPLIDSVTYNPYYEFEETTTCTTDPTTHKKTCTTELGGYSGGKYTLTANIETVQYSEYQNVWAGAQVQTATGCGPLRIMAFNPYQNLLKPNDNYNTFFGKDRASSLYVNTEKLKIMNHKNVPANAIDSWDMSFLNDGSVMLWIMDEDNNGMYEVYIGGDGGVVANPDSESAFSNLDYLKEIDVTYLDTSRVNNMQSMFAYDGSRSSSFRIIGLNTWDTSYVESMSNMFRNIGEQATTWNIGDLSNWNTSSLTYTLQMFMNAGGQGITVDFSNWDVSKIKDGCGMFENAQFTRIGINEENIACPYHL